MYQLKCQENNVCVDCFNCKLISNGKKVKCSCGYFESISIEDAWTLTPYDFDCYEYDKM